MNLTYKQQTKLPKKLQSAITKYRMGMNTMNEALKVMEKGGMTPHNYRRPYRPFYYNMGGPTFDYIGGMYGSGGYNSMAPFFGHNAAKTTYMNSPIHGVYPIDNSIGYPIRKMGGMSMYQMGGMPMPGAGAPAPMPNESGDMMASLVQGQLPGQGQPMPQQMPQEAQQQQPGQEEQLMALAQAVAAGDQEAIEVLKTLPPEIQAAVMQMVEQMQGGEGQASPEMAQGMPQPMRKGGKVVKKKRKKKPVMNSTLAFIESSRRKA